MESTAISAAAYVASTAVPAALTSADANSSSAFNVTSSDGSSSASEFLLTRLLKSFMSAIAQQAAESDVPDRRIGTFVSYLISPFAVLCISMAIILNRTVVFATTRRPAPLTIMYRVLLRSVAIYVLADSCIPLIRALKCYSPTLAPYIPSYFDMASGESCPAPSILWDLYRSICIGHFIETFSSVIQGRTPFSETGMTLFEYSMAFQEVQSAQRLSVEVLIVSIISALSQLTQHLYGMFDLYKYRLIPSSFFGITFLSFFGWSVFNGRLLYFPTACVVGYLPQLTISLVIMICAMIYLLACVFAGGPQNVRISPADVQFSLSEDFYTCLMKLGVYALASMTKGTYMNETASINAVVGTWIELAGGKAAQDSRSPYAIEASAPPEVVKSRDSRIAATRWMTLYRIKSSLYLVKCTLIVLMFMVWTRIGRLWQWRHPTGIANRLTKEGFITANTSPDSEDYSRLLMGVPLADYDDSQDYIPESDNDEEYYEYHSEEDDDNSPDLDSSEWEDEVSDSRGSDSRDSENRSSHSQGSDGPLGSRANVLQNRKYQGLVDQINDFIGQHPPGAPSPGSTHQILTRRRRRSSAVTDFHDLISSTPNSLHSLLAPQTPSEIERSRILATHLVSERILTRSQYRSLAVNEAQTFLEILQEKRRNRPDAPVSDSVCVVCQCNPRQIVLWPCRCFALCDECRLTLAVKNFRGCVCCRRDMESYSKIFIP